MPPVPYPQFDSTPERLSCTTVQKQASRRQYVSSRAAAAAGSPSFPRRRWRLRRAATARHGVVAPDLSCQHLSTRVLGWHGNEFLECLLDLVQQAVRPRFSIWISCRCRDSGGAEEVEKHAESLPGVVAVSDSTFVRYYIFLL